MHFSRRTTAAAALGVSLALAGCDSSRPGAGFTNPNAGSTSDKQSNRTDLAVPDANPEGKEPIAEAAPGSTNGTGTNAGTGGPGPKGDARQVSPEAASPTPASPPKRENTGNAQGETKPDGGIKDGNPRSPQ